MLKHLIIKLFKFINTKDFVFKNSKQRTLHSKNQKKSKTNILVFKK